MGVLRGALRPIEAPALFVLYMQACLEVYDLDGPALPLRFLYREGTVLSQGGPRVPTPSMGPTRGGNFASTASPTRGGSFDTHHLHGSRASTSLGRSRWRNAKLHGRHGSASISEGRSLDCCSSHAARMQTAQAIEMASRNHLQAALNKHTGSKKDAHETMPWRRSAMHRACPPSGTTFPR